MGTISQVPRGEGWIAKELQSIRREMREQLASTAASFNSTVAALQAQAAALQAQVNFLSSQTVVAEASPASVTTITKNNLTTNIPETWLPFDASADASVTLTTGSTGVVTVQVSGLTRRYSSGYTTAQTMIGCEILDSSGAVVLAPTNSDGPFGILWAESGTDVYHSGAGQVHRFALAPNSQRTLRCRRGYAMWGSTTSGNGCYVGFQGTSISVTKQGM